MNDLPTQYCILLAHGSSDPKWKEPFEKLTQSVSKKATAVQWDLAYMEFQTPNLVATCQSIVKKSPRAQVNIVPLFFSRGGHVANDIPNLVNEARQHYPELNLKLSNPLGALPEFWIAIENILINLLEEK